MIGQSGIAVKQVSRADAGQRGGTRKVWRRDHARGHGPSGLVGLLHAADLSECQASAAPPSPYFAHPGDNWMLHVAAELLQAGDVAVLGHLFGEYRRHVWRPARPPRSARAARVGLVIDAGCRDTAELREMGFPGMVQGGARQGHGEGHGRVGQHSHHLRRSAGASGRCGASRDDDGVVIVPQGACGGSGGSRGRARSRKKRATASDWRRANWAWISMACASRSPRRDFKYFADEGALQQESQK